MEPSILTSTTQFQSHPKVLEIFKIIIEFVWKIISYPINLGDGWQISIFHIIVFVFVLVAILGLFKLQTPKFMIGFDSYGKFSARNINKRR